MPGDVLQRLTPAEYHVLMALGDRERHLEELPGEVERLSVGTVHLTPHDLQAVLVRFVRAGLVASSTHDDAATDGGTPHRHFGLTPAGEQRLCAVTHSVVRAMKAGAAVTMLGAGRRA